MKGSEQAVDIPSEKTVKKPKWLRRLEQESWQAELVISGVAIFGSLQLPGWINQGVIFTLGFFSQEYLGFLRFVFTYALIGSQLLIFNFILHFSMRTLWVGMVGLASVYPLGLNPETDKFSQDYFSKLQKLFPSLNAFNRRLDDQCSTIFAIAAATVLVMASLSIFIVMVMLLGYLAHLVFPAWPYTGYVSSILLTFFAVSLLQGVLGTRALREKAWVKKIHFPLYRGIAMLMFNVFFKPANYIFLTFFTNFGKGRFWGGYLGYLVILMIASMGALLSSDILFMDEGFRFRRQERTSYLHSYAYRNLREEGAYIPFASIEADVITDGQMEVFIPVPEYEEKGIEAFCGTYQGEEESRKAKRAFRLDCLRQYYHFFVNDSLYTDYALYFYTHPGSGQEGIRAYLPTAGFQLGENTFRIEQQSPLLDSNRQNIIIPFQFYPK